MAEPQFDPAHAELLRTGFHTEVQECHGTIVVRLQGQLDLATAPALTRVLVRALDARPEAVIIDLAELTFLDSTGIHQLVSADRRARSRGCGFALRSPRRQVLKVLQLTCIDRFITIESACPSPSL